MIPNTAGINAVGEDNSKNPQNPIMISISEFNKFVLETFIIKLLQFILIMYKEVSLINKILIYKTNLEI